MLLQARSVVQALLHYSNVNHIYPSYALLACCVIYHQPSSYLLFFSLYFSYSLYFCPHLQPCLLLVPMSHRSSNLSNPLSRLGSASWPWTAPPRGENRCSDSHSTEHTATCGIGRACTQKMSKFARTNTKVHPYRDAQAGFQREKKMLAW